MKDFDFYVVPYDSAGFIGSTSVMGTKELAKSCQRQLRANKRYRSVKIMNREQFEKALDEDAQKRQENIRSMIYDM